MGGEFLSRAFPATPITRSGGALAGPSRRPRQLLADQHYDQGTSVHDDATAQSIGLQGGTIEGPTHFSQIEPLATALWGKSWFERGCISSHYRMPCYVGDRVTATASALSSAMASVRLDNEDDGQILEGTISIGSDHPSTCLDQRFARLNPPGELRILKQLEVGMRRPRQHVRIDYDRLLGQLYPFTLQQKLDAITEPSPCYDRSAGATSPWQRPILPFEMVSVLMQYRYAINPFMVEGKAVALFADQEIRLIDGPVTPATDYEVEREIVAISTSRRSEGLWVRSNLYRAGSTSLVATMLLNTAHVGLEATS